MVVVFEDVLLQDGHDFLDLGWSQVLCEREEGLGAVGPDLDDVVGHVLDDVLAALLEVELLAHVRHEETNASGAVGSDLLLIALAVPHHVVQALLQLLLAQRTSEYVRLGPIR